MDITDDMLSEELCSSICELIRDGVPLFEMPLHQMPPRAKIMRWMRLFPWFRVEVEAALKDGTLAVVDNLHVAAKAAKDSDDASVVSVLAKTTSIIIDEYDPSRRRQQNQQQVAVVVNGQGGTVKLDPLDEELNRITIDHIKKLRQERQDAKILPQGTEAKVTPKRLADKAPDAG